MSQHFELSCTQWQTNKYKTWTNK